MWYIYICVCVCLYVCVCNYIFALMHIIMYGTWCSIHRPILTEYLEDQRTRSFLSGIIILACETSKSNMSKASTCHEWPQENSNPVPSTTLTFEILWVSSCQMGGTFDFRSYTTHHTFTAREASSAYLQAWGISGTVWLPLRTIISWWINVNYNTVIIGIHGIRIYHILMPQHGSASSNNKVCDFRKPLALADGLKLELATPACHMHALRQAMSKWCQAARCFSLTHHDKGW